MNRRFLTALTLFLSFTATVAAQGTMQDLMDNLTRLNRAMYYIQSAYVDTVNFKALTDDAISGLMSQLDPHSVFIPAEDVESTNEQLEGSFEGVGIEFAIIADTLSVQAVIVGGPCEAVGMHAGDKIVAVDGENIAGIGINNDGVRNRLRGPRGSKVILTVVRKGVREPLEFTVIRNKVPITSIDSAYEAREGVLYIKLSRFALSSTSEMLEAFALLDNYPKGMIIDLRGNGGGYLQTAIMIANLFLDRGQTIVYTEGIHSPVDYEVATGTGPYRNGPLVILVDEDSASASEILSGAVQDWDRGIIIGRRSFGKGLVQRQFTLDDGSQIRLTTSRYHTPSGRVIQSPYEEGHRTEYYHKTEERYLSGEMFSRDSINFPDSLRFKTLKLGRTVYGGGGIMPDYYIPADTTGVNSYINSVVGKGLLTEFANIYGDSNRSTFEKYSDSFGDFYEAYGSKYEAEAFRGLIDYCRENGVEGSDAEICECEKLLKTRLKALLARSVFGTDGYYRVINREEDPAFDKALEVIENWPDLLN